MISLVLDDSSLSRCGVTFNLSGAKEWGTVSVTASPAEVIKVDQYSFDGLTCNVTLSALQPVEKGEVIFTHLGSGKNCKVPLKIGMKLKKVNVSGDAYVLERPIFEQDKETRIFEISLFISVYVLYCDKYAIGFATAHKCTVCGDTEV